MRWLSVAVWQTIRQGSNVCFLSHPLYERPSFLQVIASALAVSSSMAVGKEGPMLHAGSILAVILGSK